MNKWMKSVVLLVVLALGAVSPLYAASKINLNTATSAQLESVKGVGPKLAGAIEQYRKSHHGFKTVDELKDVKGIGDKKFAKIKNSFTVGQLKPAKP